MATSTHLVPTQLFGRIQSGATRPTERTWADRMSKGQSARHSVPRSSVLNERTAISVTACDDAISASVDHKLAAAFCIPNTVEGPNDVAYD